MKIVFLICFNYILDIKILHPVLLSLKVYLNAAVSSEFGYIFSCDWLLSLFMLRRVELGWGGESGHKHMVNSLYLYRAFLDLMNTQLDQGYFGILLNS